MGVASVLFRNLQSFLPNNSYVEQSSSFHILTLYISLLSHIAVHAHTHTNNIIITSVHILLISSITHTLYYHTCLYSEATHPRSLVISSQVAEEGGNGEIDEVLRDNPVFITFSFEAVRSL